MYFIQFTNRLDRHINVDATFLATLIFGPRHFQLAISTNGDAIRLFRHFSNILRTKKKLRNTNLSFILSFNQQQQQKTKKTKYFSSAARLTTQSGTDPRDRIINSCPIEWGLARTFAQHIANSYTYFYTHTHTHSHIHINQHTPRAKNNTQTHTHTPP